VGAIWQDEPDSGLARQFIAAARGAGMTNDE